MSKKVAIITGASRGIGAATAKLLAETGYAVLVNYREQREAAESIVSQIVQKGGEAEPFKADVGSESDILAMFNFVDEKWGRLDALVNNAGVLGKQCRVQDLTVERLERIMRINVIGSFLCCREAVKRMKEGSGIVNVSSVASRLGSAGEYVDYAASKGAMDTLTIGLAKEVAGLGIRVNCVRPGFIYTDIHADGGEPDRVNRVGPTVPMKRGGQPEEVAEAICWLLSPKSSYSTGDFLDIAGGR